MKNLGTLWFRGFFVVCECSSFFLRCILRKADAAYACAGTPNTHQHTDVFSPGNFWKSRYAEYGAGCLEWMEARQADQWSQESRKPVCWSGDNPGIGPVCCEGFVQYEKAAPYGAAGLFTRANLFSVFIVIPQLLEHPKRTDLNAGLINHRLNFRGEVVPIGLHFGIFILHIYHHR